jgi:hypothetical protein
VKALTLSTALLIAVTVLLLLTPGAGFAPSEASEVLGGFAVNNAEVPGEFVVRKGEGNPVFHSNELFRAYEDFYSPRVKQLRKRYSLDEVVTGEADEFRRIMLLRHWIHSSMPIDDYDYTSTRMDPFAILDAAKAGGKFNCSHFSVVQHAVLNSFGYITRCLGVGPGGTGPRGEQEGVSEGLDGHHAVNEVWVNKFNKWVLVDAKYDLHFQKEGVPLSALEIRDEVWRNGAVDVIPAFGLECKPAVPQINDRDWGIWATPQVYRWCSWETSTNRFTSFPAALSSTLVMYDDEIFREHIWYRDSKPHWAYDTPYLITTTQRDWIYWTPNVISSQVAIRGQDGQDAQDNQNNQHDQNNQHGQDDQDDRVHIFLLSFTPNFETFQVKIAEGNWRDCDEGLNLPLQKQLNRFVFRTVNLFGVTGPEHRVEIEWKELGP